MYARTIIDKSTVERLVGDEERATMFIDLLVGRALLLMTESDLEELSRSLPTSAWKKLEQYMISRRVPMRKISGVANRSSADPQPEVSVTRPPSDTASQPIRVTMGDYATCPTVAKRYDLRDRRRRLKSREEFWDEALLPVLDSFAPEQRTVYLVDQYAFQDLRRNIRDRNGNITKVPDRKSGLVWLLSKFNGASVNLESKLLFKIVTAESDGDDGIDFEEMTEIISLVASSISVSALDLRLAVVPSSQMRPTPSGFRLRRLIVGGHADFALGKGGVDFTEGMANFNQEGSESGVNLAGFYAPSLNHEELKVLTNLLRNEQLLQCRIGS